MVKHRWLSHSVKLVTETFFRTCVTQEAQRRTACQQGSSQSSPLVSAGRQAGTYHCLLDFAPVEDQALVLALWVSYGDARNDALVQLQEEANNTAQPIALKIPNETPF